LYISVPKRARFTVWRSALCSSSTKQRDVLDGALEELDIGGARLSGIVPGKAEHLVGHVDPVGEPGLADSTGRQQDVDPRRQSPVKHLLTLPKFRDGNGATAGVVDLQDSVTRWTSPSRERAKSDLEIERERVDLEVGAAPPLRVEVAVEVSGYGA
jgi:hypothetical protein